MTIQDLLDQVWKAMGGPIQDLELTFAGQSYTYRTVDTVKAGDASQEVRGVVTTFMATVPVLRRAVELDANLVLTHEPTYFNGADDVSALAEDPVYRAKLDLIQESGVVVGRLHDHPHGMARRSPAERNAMLGDPNDDPFFMGLVESLGCAASSERGAKAVGIVARGAEVDHARESR